MLFEELKKLKHGTPILGFEDFSPELTLNREITPSLTGWNMKRKLSNIKVDFVEDEIVNELVNQETIDPYSKYEIGIITYDCNKPIGIYLGYKFMKIFNVERIFLKVLSDNKIGWLAGILVEGKVYIY